MPSAAESLLPLIQQLCGGQPPLRIRCWDGSEISTADCNACATGDGQPASDAAIVITSPVALRRILWQPNELGFSRAYVAGEIEVEGGIWPLFQLQALLSHADRPNGSKARLRPAGGCLRPCAVWAHWVAHRSPRRKRRACTARSTPVVATLRRLPTTTTSPTTSIASFSARR